MRFFTPDKDLLESLVKYADGRIIDIGCGTGGISYET